ncbi:MAG: hypothetical protein ABW328_08300 [Ilumatobacteraceae bacterium]
MGIGVPTLTDDGSNRELLHALWCVDPDPLMRWTGRPSIWAASVTTVVTEPAQNGVGCGSHRRDPDEYERLKSSGVLQ